MIMIIKNVYRAYTKCKLSFDEANQMSGYTIFIFKEYNILYVINSIVYSHDTMQVMMNTAVRPRNVVNNQKCSKTRNVVTFEPES